MPTLSSLLSRTGLHRWKLFLAIYLLILATATLCVGVPGLRWLVHESREMLDGIEAVRNVETLPERIRTIESQERETERLLAQAAAQPAFHEATVLEKLYNLCDSAEFSAGKILLGDRIPVTDAVEIPISVTGEGTYTAAGELIAGIENLDFPTRVRQITMKKKKDGIGTVEVEFVGMDKR